MCCENAGGNWATGGNNPGDSCCFGEWIVDTSPTGEVNTHCEDYVDTWAPCEKCRNENCPWSACDTCNQAREACCAPTLLYANRTACESYGRCSDDHVEWRIEQNRDNAASRNQYELDRGTNTCGNYVGTDSEKLPANGGDNYVFDNQASCFECDGPRCWSKTEPAKCILRRYTKYDGSNLWSDTSFDKTYCELIGATWMKFGHGDTATEGDCVDRTAENEEDCYRKNVQRNFKTWTITNTGSYTAAVGDIVKRNGVAVGLLKTALTGQANDDIVFTATPDLTFDTSTAFTIVPSAGGSTVNVPTSEMSSVGTPSIGQVASAVDVGKVCGNSSFLSDWDKREIERATGMSRVDTGFPTPTYIGRHEPMCQIQCYDTDATTENACNLLSNFYWEGEKWQSCRLHHQQSQANCDATAGTFRTTVQVEYRPRKFGTEEDCNNGRCEGSLGQIHHMQFSQSDCKTHSEGACNRQCVKCISMGKMGTQLKTKTVEFTFDTGQAIGKPSGVTVTQTENGVVKRGTLKTTLIGTSSTMYITARKYQAFTTTADLVIDDDVTVDHARLASKTEETDPITITFNSGQTINKDAGDTVYQKQRWGSEKEKTRNAVYGTLKTAVSGSSTTSIQILGNSDSDIFRSDWDLVIDGDVTVLAQDLDSVGDGVYPTTGSYMNAGEEFRHRGNGGCFNSHDELQTDWNFGNRDTCEGNSNCDSGNCKWHSCTDRTWNSTDCASGFNTAIQTALQCAFGGPIVHDWGSYMEEESCPDEATCAANGECQRSWDYASHQSCTDSGWAYGEGRCYGHYDTFEIQQVSIGDNKVPQNVSVRKNEYCNSCSHTNNGVCYADSGSFGRDTDGKCAADFGVILNGEDPYWKYHPMGCKVSGYYADEQGCVSAQTWTLALQPTTLHPAQRGTPVVQGTVTCTDPDGGTLCNAHNADATTCMSTDGGSTARVDGTGNTCVFQLPTVGIVSEVDDTNNRLTIKAEDGVTFTATDAVTYTSDDGVLRKWTTLGNPPL
jgi:hypothetical protein